MWQQLLNHIREDQAGLDRAIEAWTAGYALLGGRIFCGNGCSGCCTLAVNCTFTEAASIAKGLPPQLVAELDRHVAKLLENIRSAVDLKSYLQLQRNTIGPCPFLDKTGSCSIYSLRPFSCRALLATKENRWCSLDFAELSSGEKQQYVESLDRSVVAFPMHYAAMPQEMGEELETGALRHMAEQCGFSLYGNMPFLVWLEKEHHIRELISQGMNTTSEFLSRQEFDNHFLVSIAP